MCWLTRSENVIQPSLVGSSVSALGETTPGWIYLAARRTVDSSQPTINANRSWLLDLVPPSTSNTPSTT